MGKEGPGGKGKWGSGGEVGEEDRAENRKVVSEG